ncbi:MAG: ABC transporter ATP-binding protein [Pirellulaceae bacterium]|jgi:ABC-2 type transport system ATP-binding protein|nr:ABC transporter ATP-binding protein [Pirellulaceae bacterium]
MSDEIVTVQQLSRVFGRTVALADVTLSVARGAVFGLVGENGAGKTTLIKHLLGLYRPEYGHVRVFGSDPVGDPVGVLGRIGYLSEDRDLPEWMRVGELMSYTRAFYPRWDEDLARELIEMFELDIGQKIRTLSRGQRARAGLLIAVAHRPDLLLLDEPSSGLDPGARQDILAAIVRTVADEGRTVLLSSHLLHEVQRVADHVAMLHRGRLVLNEPLDDLLARHRWLTVQFASALPAQPDWPGALWWTGQDAEWTCLCNGQWLACKQAAEEAGATIVEERLPSLEEVFLARTKGVAAGSRQP